MRIIRILNGINYKTFCLGISLGKNRLPLIVYLLRARCAHVQVHVCAQLPFVSSYSLRKNALDNIYYFGKCTLYFRMAYIYIFISRLMTCPRISVLCCPCTRKVIIFEPLEHEQGRLGAQIAFFFFIYVRYECILQCMLLTNFARFYFSTS